MREAEKLTGIAAADFSRIRKAKLERFTIDRLMTILDRLMTILDRLGQEIRIQVKVRPRKQSAKAIGAH